MKPDDLLFAETHEWVHVEEQGGQKIATVGVSAFAVEQMTDLVFLALPDVGRSIQAGESFGEIESVKAVSDLYSPLAGEVTEVNAGLPDSLETLGRDPYGEGWMLKLRITDDAGLEKLMDYSQYQTQCAAEG